MDPEMYPRRQPRLMSGVTWEGSFCKTNVFFPIDKLNAKVICPSIFGGNVVRNLTPTELMDCLDISADHWESFLQTDPSEFPRLPFSKTVPIKVLACLLEGVYPCEEMLVHDYSLGPDRPGLLPVTEEKPAKLASGAVQDSVDLLSADKVTSVTEEVRQKAAKDGDATVEFEFWNAPFLDKLLQMGRSQSFVHQLRVATVSVSGTPLLEALRTFILQVWRRTVHPSFCRFMRIHHGVGWVKKSHPDVSAGRECLMRAAGATFWEWTAGSRLFFWRWPEESRVWARDGHPVYVSGALPQFRKVQPREPDPAVCAKVKEKLEKFIGKGYTTRGRVNSLVSYFTVPKGEPDVRLVFDGTKSGLNAALWAPSFHFPTVESLLPALTPGAWQGGIEIAEMFYNYALDPAIQPYCGVDIHPYLSTTDQPRLSWSLWGRCVMGLKSSPHGCVKMQSLAEELIRGDMTLSSNPFTFDSVILNLPGSPTYDPRQAKVIKFNSVTGQVAGDVTTYVDDTHFSGSTFAHCWAVSHRVGHLCYLGIQDALRKRTQPSQRAGAWTGTLTQTPPEGIIISCTQDKWDRARGYIAEMLELARQDLPFCHKTLECQRGFLVYVTRTYPSLAPYLKGIHLTLDSWHPGRNSEGWKSHDQVAAHLGLENPSELLTSPPKVVRAVPRLLADLEGLLTLFQLPHPPVRVVRTNAANFAFYGFGDASGSGFGSTITTPKGIHYRYGIWGDDLAGLSSNYRELFNLT